MELQELEYFCTVAAEGSLSRAAQHLNYAQSNLSTKIMKLEEELDALLFYRSNQGVSLTPKGEVLYQYATKMLHMAKETTEALKDTNSGCTIQLGTTEANAISFLPKFLSTYTPRHPFVSLQVETSVTDSIISRVLDRSFDLAFITGTTQHPELSCHFVYEEELVIVSHKKYGTDCSYKKILENPMLVFTKGCTCRKIFEKFLEHEDAHPKQIMEAENLSTIFSNVISGLGIACFPRSCVEFYKAHFPIYIYEMPLEFRKATISLIHRKDTYLSKAICDFINLAVHL